MDNRKLYSILDSYYAQLQEFGIEPECLAEDPHADLRSLSHIMWMCVEIKRQHGFDCVEKRNRWLGFIQGVLWARGVYSIDFLREQMRVS